jgi:hypothetical protein
MPQPIQQSVILLESASHIATPDVGPPDQTPANEYPFLTNNQRFVGAHVLFDVTDLEGGAPDVTVSIDGYDYGSSTWYNLLTGLSVVTVSFNIYKIHPDFTAAANLVAKEGIPYLWRVILTHDDAAPITYSLGVNYLD